MMSRDWIKGVEAAASLASEYDSSSTHEYRLEDCILCKLNVTNLKKPRRNRDRLQHPNFAFTAGMVLALAEVHRMYGCSSTIVSVAKDAGITLAIARASGVDAYDWRELRRAGVR